MPKKWHLFSRHYLIENTSYDYSTCNNIPYESFTIIGALLNSIGVCEGISKLNKLLLDNAELKSIIVSGEAYQNKNSIKEPHAWNIIKIGNNLYHTDVTWDMITYKYNKLKRYNYFNKTDSELSSDHFWNKNFYPQCLNTFSSFLGW